MRIWKLLFILMFITIGNCSRKNPVAVVNTSQGEFSILLYRDKSPEMVNHFVELSEAGFYNGQIVHMISPGKLIKTGCPEGTGTGGPGYTIDVKVNEELSHKETGMVSLYNPGTDKIGSQFFFILTNLSYLDSLHPIIGKVTQGMEVVETIGNMEVDKKSRPVENIIIQSISIQ